MGKTLLFDICSVGHSRTGNRKRLLCYRGRSQCPKIDHSCRGFFGDDCFDPTKFPTEDEKPLTSKELKLVREIIKEHHSYLRASD